MKIRDNLGWPVETFKNKPFTNFLRYLIHGSIKNTWKLRNHDDKVPSSGDVQTNDPDAVASSIARSVMGRVYRDMGGPLMAFSNGVATVTFRKKTLLRNSYWLKLPAGLNVQIHPGDTMVLRPLGDGIWECLQYEHNQVVTQSYHGAKWLQTRADKDDMI